MSPWTLTDRARVRPFPLGNHPRLPGVRKTPAREPLCLPDLILAPARLGPRPERDGAGERERDHDGREDQKRAALVEVHASTSERCALMLARL